MADPSFVTDDEKIVPGDRGDGIFKTLKRYIKGDKTSCKVNKELSDKPKDISLISDTAEPGDKIHNEILPHIVMGDKNRSHIYGEESRATKSTIHHGGFNFRVNSRNEMAVMETKRKDTGSPPKEHVPYTDDCYKFDHARRGYMIQIVNEHFLGGNDGQRKGVSEDFKRMEDIKNKFGFELLNSDLSSNLTKPQIKQLLRRAQQTDHSNCDCFVFMISTHGEKLPDRSKNDEENYGLLCSDEQIIQISEIITALNDVNCPTLKDKPKLFFIQACRGSETDDGNSVHVEQERHSDDGNLSCNTSDIFDAKGSQETPSGTYHSSHIYTHSATPEFESPYLNCDNDMLVMFAAPPGMCAWRSESVGSWMLQDLHKVLMGYNFAKPKSLLKVLTKVSWMMTRRVTRVQEPALTGKVIVPVIENKLSKDILFQK